MDSIGFRRCDTRIRHLNDALGGVQPFYVFWRIPLRFRGNFGLVGGFITIIPAVAGRRSDYQRSVDT